MLFPFLLLVSAALHAVGAAPREDGHAVGAAPPREDGQFGTWRNFAELTAANTPAIDAAFDAMMEPERVTSRLLDLLQAQAAFVIAPVSFMEHGVQMATRALRAGWSEDHLKVPAGTGMAFVVDNTRVLHGRIGQVAGRRRVVGGEAPAGAVAERWAEVARVDG